MMMFTDLLGHVRCSLPPARVTVPRPSPLVAPPAFRLASSPARHWWGGPSYFAGRPRAGFGVAAAEGSDRPCDGTPQ